jgi:hypothetical protein
VIVFAIAFVAVAGAARGGRLFGGQPQGGTADAEIEHHSNLQG